ncbi:MAG TPA: NAD(P)-binding protein [Caulobacteraceae bacterium]|jgi:uncharacterized protein with NAD-binding domain and iron-sulfur cluster
MAQAGGPTRVVILGGGPAGCAAAYWLTRPEQQGKYQVTLYSQGWRLGGKCASGRNAEYGQRIEEHGLHMLMGCYWNAFATLRALYLDWRTLKPDPKSPFQTWINAFLPQRLVSMMSQDGPGTPPSWSPWNFPFPQMPGEPGDGPLLGIENGWEPPSPDAMILRIAHLMDAHTPANAPFKQALTQATNAIRAVFLSNAPNTSAAQAAIAAAASQVHSAMGGGPAGQVGGQDEERLEILIDIGLAVSAGFMEDIYDKGPNAWMLLNQQDFRAWLANHGLSETAQESAPIDAFYDLTFAANFGREVGRGQGSLAAGVSLKAQMEIVTAYANAPLFKMAAGTGDTIFTPYWDVLIARGVNIELFSRVASITPSTEGTEISQIVINTQAVTADGSPYDPFVPVQNLDCWPNQPNWSQLKNGANLQAEGIDFESSYCHVTAAPPTILVAGQDFDIAISALPPDALAVMPGGVAEANTAWATALSESRSVGTQSLQLWMTKSLAGLGWTSGPTVLTAFEEPYDSWGDMSQTLSQEAWPGPAKPASVGYLCGCLGEALDPPFSPKQMNAMAAGAATQWMKLNLTTLWPNAGPDPVQSPFSRYGQANFDISDTYVQTPAGDNVGSRLNPAAPAGFSNLYAIGDWTLTRFSGGCFESAVESAMLSSQAISSFPPYVKSS